MHSHEHLNEHEADKSPKSRRWLGIASVANFVMGASQVVLGSVSGSNVMISEGSHNFVDSIGYFMNHRAAGHELEDNHERARRINRRAGSIICGVAVAVGLHAGMELVNGTASTKPGLLEKAVLYGGALINIAVARGLHPDAQEGGSHKMGWLHAASDIAGSVVNSAGMILTAQGTPHADQIAALMSSAIYVGMNLPTNNRIGHDHS